MFEITVENAGELSAEKTTDIKGPVLGEGEDNDGPREGQGGGGPEGFGGMSMMRVSNLTIQDLVPEGTIVKKGDYVAQLDRTTYQNTLATAREELINLEANLEIAILDTALSLSDLRDAIVSQQYAIEEAKIKVDMSQYEAPATIRQREADLDKQKENWSKLSHNMNSRKKILINIAKNTAKR